jgi:signal transduction histidine kinase
LKSFTVADGFPAAYVMAITEDAAGTIWIGTALGELWRYRDGKFTNYRPPDTPTEAAAFTAAAAADPMKEHNRGALSGGERFWALYADDEGVIWIGTLGGGLLRFQHGTFTRYTFREGLPNEHISQILEDGRGSLWLGTRGGIVRVNKTALNQFAQGETHSVSFTTYGKVDGLPTAECSGEGQPACWRNRDGRLWFATVKGVVWVDPPKVPFNSVPPPVVIEEVSVDGRRVSESGQPMGRPAVPLPSRLTVAPGQHYLDFKFTALSLTSPDKVRFKWRLAGLEPDWSRASDERSVSYSFVPPGNYEFQVQACNNDGVWNETGAAIKLTVQPYFWQTRWFPWAAMLALVAGTAGAVTLALRARHRRRLARLEVLRVTEQERSRIARDLHDELGSGLTEVTMLTAPFSGVELSPEKLRERLQRAGDRAHGLVEALDEIVWAVDPAKDNLPALAKYFAGYVEEFLKDSHIACQVQMPVAFPERPVKAQVRHQLFLAVREAVTNAVRHAQPGRIGFAMELTGDWQLQITITDDGRGFDPDTIKAGNGLANLRTRLNSLGGDCKINSHPGGGTTVRLMAALSDNNQDL